LGEEKDCQMHCKMRGIIRFGFAMAAFGATPLAITPSAAQESMLRCVTAPVSIRPGQHAQHFAPRRLYAPARSAMFFFHVGSVCRWKAPLHRGT